MKQLLLGLVLCTIALVSNAVSFASDGPTTDKVCSVEVADIPVDIAAITDFDATVYHSVVEVNFTEVPLQKRKNNSLDLVTLENKTVNLHIDPGEYQRYVKNDWKLYLNDYSYLYTNYLDKSCLIRYLNQGRS